MMWIIRYLLPSESETECVKCNHGSSCSAGLPNCATHSPKRKPSKSIRMLVMSFNPAMKKFSRPVFDPVQGVPAPGWQYALAFAIFILLLSFIGAVK